MRSTSEAELGFVSRLRVLHLQCHFGKDSLVLASRGAEVKGTNSPVYAVLDVSLRKTAVCLMDYDGCVVRQMVSPGARGDRATPGS